jgi:hypothetical protein
LKGLYLGIRKAAKNATYDRKVMYELVQRYKQERQEFIEQCECKGWGAPPDLNPFNPLGD